MNDLEKSVKKARDVIGILCKGKRPRDYEQISDALNRQEARIKELEEMLRECEKWGNKAHGNQRAQTRYIRLLKTALRIALDDLREHFDSSTTTEIYMTLAEARITAEELNERSENPEKQVVEDNQLLAKQTEELMQTLAECKKTRAEKG